jgi:uncharacterized protein YyaL (SSP411 family)
MNEMTKTLKVLLVLLALLLWPESMYSQDIYTQTNELSAQSSPYLLQHAKNPVAWKIWDNTALKKAKDLDRLLVISVGYASCHWCHVMEEESFEDGAVADLMINFFVNIKVDREERPDIDQTYMTALSLMGKQTGWPLNVVALPDGTPIYGGTYHSKTQWMAVLKQLKDLYSNQPEKIRSFGKDLKNGMTEALSVQVPLEGANLNQLDLANGMIEWQKKWDLEWGGLKGDQKFMRPNSLEFLLSYGQLSKDSLVLSYVETTLDKMASGGIFDQIGGGFYRYSTDPNWKVPHFEKMLYDNAQLVQLYSKAFKFFKKERYEEVVAKTYDFLKREMKLPNGGYAAALDADFSGEEGLFYIWTPQELKALIPDGWELFSAYYGLLENDLWEDRYWILQAPEDIALFKATHGLTQESFEALRSEWEQLLLEARNERGAPLRDHKLITSWNALLVSAYAEAYNAFGDAHYLEGATQLYGLITFLAPEKLRHINKAGEATPVFTQDYVYLSQAVLALYFSTNNPSYLDAAENNMTYLNSRFYHAEKSAYAFGDTADLMAPLYVFSDGVMPSDNGVAAQVNFLIGHIKFQPEATEKAEKAMQNVQAFISSDLENYTQWGQVYLYKLYPYYELAILGPQAFYFAKKMNQLGLPNVLVVGSQTPSELPLFQDRYAAGETLLYVCVDYSCKLPVSTVSEALEQLQ